MLRDGEAVIHDPETFSQLASIEGATLRAPEGQPDDRATAFALAVAGRWRLRTMYPADADGGGPCILTSGREPDPIFGPHQGPFFPAW